MLNTVNLMGRFTKDPELKQTQSGVSTCSFSLAVDRDFNGQNGEKQVDFINCVAWRSTAEFISKYFTKGAQAVVGGRLQVRPWETKEGEKRQAVEVVVDHIYFCGSKQDNGAKATKATAAQEPPAEDDNPCGGYYEEGDLPF